MTTRSPGTIIWRRGGKSQGCSRASRMTSSCWHRLQTGRRTPSRDDALLGKLEVQPFVLIIDRYMHHPVHRAARPAASRRPAASGDQSPQGHQPWRPFYDRSLGSRGQAGWGPRQDRRVKT